MAGHCKNPIHNPPNRLICNDVLGYVSCVDADDANPLKLGLLAMISLGKRGFTDIRAVQLCGISGDFVQSVKDCSRAQKLPWSGQRKVAHT